MPKICSHKDCGTPVFSKGMCQYHWRAWKGSQQSLVQTDRVPAKSFKAISDKHSKRLAKYRVVRDEVLKERPVCEWDGCESREVTLHHGAGKIGSLLWNKKYMKSLCWSHHEYCERHPDEAKKLGLSFDRLDK